MNIAILVPRSDRSFVVRHMVDLAKELQSQGNEVRLVTALVSEAHGFAEELGENHICMGLSGMTRAVAAFANMMKSGAPDLLVSATLEANCTAGLARRMAGIECPLVFFEKSVPGYEDTGGVVSNKFWSWMRKKAYLHADKIIAPSYEVRRRLLNLTSVPEDRIVQIFNPGRGYFSPPIKAPHPWLSEARLEPTFVAAGPLEKNSDFETLIRGVSVAQKFLPCKMIILGDGPEKKRLFEYSRSLSMRNHVTFASDIENLHDYVYFCDGFVSTAKSSACPDVVLRAMELTSRVICTASPGGSREILGEGKYGKMLRMEDPDALAYALYESIQTAKMKPGERDISRFDRTSFFARVSAELHEVVENSRRAAIENSAKPLELRAA
jgi:glycosyltransferase involved in cell wall biosynthesis